MDGASILPPSLPPSRYFCFLISPSLPPSLSPSLFSYLVVDVAVPGDLAVVGVSEEEQALW